MKQNKQYWLIAAVFGSMWGISEAVVGTMLHGLSHFLPITGLSGLVMFPIGFFFMHRAFVRTGSRNVIFQTAAIAAAIGLAGPADIVLIAGKGHEDYQIVGSRKFPFDDRSIAREELRLWQTGREGS